MKSKRIRPMGVIRIFDPRGYSYLPKIIREELGTEGRDEVPFFINANCVLLVRKGADLREIIEGLEVLKRDLLLRAEKRD